MKILENFGKVCDTDLNICQKLGISYNTWKELYKTFINDWGMTKAKTNAKDSETKDNKYLYTFDLETIRQAVLLNRKKIEEHDKDIQDLKDANIELDKEIKDLKHQIQILNSNLNLKNQEELKSNIKLKIV